MTHSKVKLTPFKFRDSLPTHEGTSFVHSSKWSVMIFLKMQKMTD